MCFIYFNIIDTELTPQSADHGMSEMEDDSNKQKPGFISEKLNLEQRHINYFVQDILNRKYWTQNISY